MDNNMGYQEAIEAAGAEVHAFESFGSYQGDWWALVTYKDETGFVHGSYGSCSGCDAFQAEFDWDVDTCEEHKYHDWDERKDCKACEQAQVVYHDRLATFGNGYISSSLMTKEEAIAYIKPSLEWDSEALEMLQWIESR